MASRGRGAAQRGANYERRVVGYLTDQFGLRAERIRSGRSTDAGDIVWPGSRWLLDCKSQQRWSVDRWFTEAEAEAAAEGVAPAVLLDRPGTTDVGRSLLVVRLSDAGDLLT